MLCSSSWFVDPWSGGRGPAPRSTARHYQGGPGASWARSVVGQEARVGSATSRTRPAPPGREPCLRGQRTRCDGSVQRVAPVAHRREPGARPAVVPEHASTRGAAPVGRTRALSVGSTRSGSSPASSKIARAKPNQEVWPGVRAVVDARRGIRVEQRDDLGGEVGRPGRLADAGRRRPTTVSCVAASRSIVAAKLGPSRAVEPGGAHDVRAVRMRGAATSASPAALLRPYALIGSRGASSAYGVGARCRRRRSRSTR